MARAKNALNDPGLILALAVLVAIVVLAITGGGGDLGGRLSIIDGLMGAELMLAGAVVKDKLPSS